MPLDPVMLERLGLRDIPRWFREKHNLPSLAYPGRGIGDMRQPLPIQDRPPMAALPSSETSANGNGKFTKSPPRGPANRGATNGAHNTYRGPNRNGTNTWKNTRNGRNRAMSVTRQSVCSEQSGDRWSSKETTPPTNDVGLHRWSLKTPSLNSSPAQTASHSSASATRVSPVVPNIASNQSLLDDGNSRTRALGWKLKELTENNQDVFEPVSGISLDVPSRRKPVHRLYEHSSNPSSDGGVMLPKDLNLDFSNTTVYPYADIVAGKVSASSAPPKSAMSTGGSSTPRLEELTTADNALLHSVDTQVTWGPIGGPIYMRAGTPPADLAARMFGPVSKRPGTH